MDAISDLPTLHDMDADYSPQYVKLARILRDKITSGQYKHGDPLPAAMLAGEHKVSMRVVWHTMDMLAANRYVHRPGNFAAYVVTWQAGALCRGGNPEQRLCRASRQPSSARTSALSARARGGPKSTSLN
jgi:DNA-binding transcriptional MocR family regulator